jgi:hypothetical protein
VPPGAVVVPAAPPVVPPVVPPAVWAEADKAKGTVARLIAKAPAQIVLDKFMTLVPYSCSNFLKSKPRQSTSEN